MAINRTIQFKRNGSIAQDASTAKNNIANIASGLTNGEIALGIYSDSKAVNGMATVIAIKGNDRIFYDDNQTILNKLGILHDGSEDVNAANDSFLKKVQGISNDIEVISGAVDEASDAIEVVSGDVEAVSGAVDVVSGVVDDIKEFIGMDGSQSGDSIVDKIEAVSGNLNTLSGKVITDIEDTVTIDLTKEDAADGTQKIKADVKISAVSGNIITTKNDGIYTRVDYDPLKNALIINDDEKPINAGSIIDSIEYSADTESLVINYSDMSGGTHSVTAPLGDLIEEYHFDTTTDADHNTKFTVTRNVSGETTIQADVQNFDCGEY